MTPKAKAGGRGGGVAQPAARSAASASAMTLSPALSQRRGRFLFIGEFLKAIERLEGFLRAELVGPDLLERGAQVRVGCRRGRIGGAEEIRLARVRPQLLLELGQVAARRAHHILRDSGEVRDMDAVGAIRGAALELVQEDDAVAVLDRVEVDVGDVRQLGGELREL